MSEPTRQCRPPAFASIMAVHEPGQTTCGARGFILAKRMLGLGRGAAADDARKVSVACEHDSRDVRGDDDDASAPR